MTICFCRFLLVLWVLLGDEFCCDCSAVRIGPNYLLYLGLLGVVVEVAAESLLDVRDLH